MARRGASIRVGRIHRGRGARPTWENLSFVLCPGWSTREGPIQRRLGFNYGPRKSSANHAKMPTGGRCFSGRAAFRDSTSYAHCSSKDRANREQGGRNGYPRLSSPSVSAAGVGVIVVAIATAGVRFARGLARDEPFDDSYRHLRQSIGRGILLGLELLVAGDIIRTVAIAPTFSSVGVLGVIVAIRTFLSFSLEVELTGHWPWQQKLATDDAQIARERAHAPGALRHDRTRALSNSACIVKRAVPAGLTA